MNNVVRLRRRPRPRTFTKREEISQYLSELIRTSGQTYSAIALKVGVTGQTIGKIAREDTLWPRHTTLFGLLEAFNVEIEFRTPDRRA